MCKCARRCACKHANTHAPTHPRTPPHTETCTADVHKRGIWCFAGHERGGGLKQRLRRGTVSFRVAKDFGRCIGCFGHPTVCTRDLARRCGLAVAAVRACLGALAEVSKGAGKQCGVPTCCSLTHSLTQYWYSGAVDAACDGQLHRRVDAGSRRTSTRE